MIIFLYGPDVYRSRRKLREIIEHYKKTQKSGLNLRYFEAQNLNYREFKDEFQQVSMFKEKKMLVLFDVFSNPSFKEQFLKEKSNYINSDNIIVFYETESISPNNSFFKFLIKEAKSQKFDFLEGQKLRNWINKEFENRGVRIEPLALEKLIDYAGNNLWRQVNEIQKLTVFKIKSPSREISKKDIELLVKPEFDLDVFKTIEAAAARNKKKAVLLIKKHLEKGDNPSYLLSMINYQFRNLLIIKSFIENRKPYYFIQKATKLHPFVFQKSYPLTDKFTFPELKKIYQKIFQIDLQIKTGKLNPEIALDLLISEI